MEKTMNAFFLLIGAMQGFCSAPVDVDSLLSTMTLEEKIGQMTLIDLPALNGNYSDLEEYAIGAVLCGGDSNPEINTVSHWADIADSVQFWASATRLSIPILFGIDAVHGHNNVEGATIFPHNIGMGATRDTSLCRRIAQATACEMLATGIYWDFAPCLAVPQDERWGRYYEGFSENESLVSELGNAYVLGFQNPIGDRRHVLPCLKHWVGDGAVAGGIDRGNAVCDSALFYKKHIFPYRKAVENGAGSMMASFSSWNGEPCHAHHFLLNDLLRGDLGFDGFVVSDWAAIDLLPGDYYHDVVQSVNAGIDMVMVPIEYKKFINILIQATKNGDVSENRINQACKRILKAKADLGLFTFAGAHRDLIDSVGCRTYRSIGREAVAKSCVVLKNEANALPLKRLPDTVFVVGRHADNVGLQCGGWTIGWQGASGPITAGTTLLGALQERYPMTTFIYSHFGEDIVCADLCIVAVGEMPYAEWFGYDQELELPPQMEVPLQNARYSGATVVTVLFSGRPLILDNILPYSDALVEAWLPGSEAGGIVDVLSGDRASSGKLSVTWPRSVSSIPLDVDDYTNRNALFPFGFGMDLPSTKESSYVNAMVVAGGSEICLFRDSSWSPIGSVVSVLVSDSLATVTDVHERGLNHFIVLGEQIHSGDDVSVEFYSGGELLGVEAENIATTSISVPSMFACTEFSWQKKLVIEEAWDDRGVFASRLKKGGALYFSIHVDVAGTYRVLLRGKGHKATVAVSVGNEGEKIIQFLSDAWETKELPMKLPAGETVLHVSLTDGTWSGNWISFDTFAKTRSRSPSR